LKKSCGFENADGSQRYCRRVTNLIAGEQTNGEAVSALPGVGAPVPMKCTGSSPEYDAKYWKVIRPSAAVMASAEQTMAKAVRVFHMITFLGFEMGSTDLIATHVFSDKKSALSGGLMRTH
jgi:hypothetical protein